MVHYLLPQAPDGAEDTSRRYGDTGIRELIENLRAQGARPCRLVAKIFGGASVVGNPHPETAVGQKNIDLARRLLDAENVPIVAEDVGECRGRRVVFHPDTGAAWVRKV